jgi:cupin superfamily acireductone dioxygenase involved in methionine salvage
MSENIHKKSWGYEHWFANNDFYCGKYICIEKDCISSNGAFHYHKSKDETFFVLEGTLILDYYTDNHMYTIHLNPHQSFRIKPNVKHRFSTKSDMCGFIEASTHHSDKDSYRVIFEDNLWKKVDPEKNIEKSS